MKVKSILYKNKPGSWIRLTHVRKVSIYIGLWVCLLVFFSSCIPTKKLVYFPNPRFNTTELTPITNQANNYRLQPRDVLSIRIKTLDPESSEYFNLNPENAFFNYNQASAYINGYSIDEKGNIDLPEAGLVNVAGLTVNEAQIKIEKSISTYLKRANIVVKLVSFKITVLGEVNNPGHYYIYNNQATLLEGLGMAGDMTDFGNRENITLVRQMDKGLGAVLINLKDARVLSSPFYYLQPNDVIYVQPLKAKNTRSNLNTFNVLSIAFGAISSLVLLLNFLN
jgi:polysaccharide biosynthesis/export protein